LNIFRFLNYVFRCKKNNNQNLTIKIQNYLNFKCKNEKKHKKEVQNGGQKSRNEKNVKMGVFFI